MVCDDQVQAKTPRRLRFRKGTHSCINRNHQPHALGISRFKHARLQPVSLAQAMRNMKAHRPTEHLDRCFQQDHSSRAVHIVIAVEQHRLASGDGLLQPIDCSAHAHHEQGIMEM